MKPLDVLLTVLASARATRFITSDTLGHWWLVRPARTWAVSNAVRAEYQNLDVDAIWHDLDPTHESKRVKLVSGLDCPFCVGFWIGAAVLVTGLIPGLRPLWRLGTAILSLNYVVGHVSSRID